MADIICRVCGEPWGSTGGLHHTHSDLTWWCYDELIRGRGCPRCDGVRPDGVPQGQFNDAWQRSVAFLADGSITGDPYKGWPKPTWPAYCKEADGSYRYRDANDDPWEDIIPASLRAMFPDKDCKLSEHPERKNAEEPKRLTYGPCEETMIWTGVWVPLGHDKISDSGEAPLLERCNGKALQKMLGDEDSGVQHFYVDEDGNFWVGVAYIRYDRATVFDTAVKFVHDVLRSLENNALLDDDLYSEMEAEAKGDLLEEILEREAPWEWSGAPALILKGFLETKKSEILAEIELDTYGKESKRPDELFFKKLLVNDVEPVHHEILRSNLDPQVYVLYPKSFEVVSNYGGVPSEFLTGLLLFARGAEGGAKVKIEVRPLETIPRREFMAPGSSNTLRYVKWSTLGFTLQDAILDLIAGREHGAYVDFCWWPHAHD